MVSAMSTSESHAVEASRLDHAPGRDAAARQASLREHNLALVLATIVRADTRGRPIPRSQIAAETGLTKATVSELADVLICAKLVQELDRDTPARAGRPATPWPPPTGPSSVSASPSPLGICARPWST